MACVPPRAGLDAPQEPSIIQGVQSTLYLQKHWKMRQALYGSCKSRPQVWHVRGTASQAVIVDDTEASQKKTTRWRRWQAHETMVLITAKQQQELGQLERAEAENGSKRVKKKWEEIEAFCQENGIERTAQQCKDRWDRLMVTYSQIRSWEKTRRPDKLSFWSMKLDERKAEGFLLNLDQETYNALDEVHNHEGRMAVSDVLVENDVEDKPEIGGVDYSLHKYDAKQHAVDEADLGSGHGQEHMDEVAVGMNALLRYDILQSNEEKQNGGLPSDNESGEKVQPVSISNSGSYHLEKCEVDVKDVIENPVSLLKGIEGLKSSIMSTYLDNADSIHQNSESRSIQHQFLPAETAQRMDGTNSVFEHSIEHDCNETKTEWGQATGTTLGLKKAIPVKSVEWREEIQNKKIMSTLLHASPEKLGDSYKGQLLHASPAKVDDCYKDQHQHLIADSLVHHQKELGVKEDINVTVGYDVENNQSTGLKQDGMMHFARNENGEEQSKGADWISAAYHETEFSATTDGLEVGVRSDNANFMITLEGRETCKGQKTVSQLISCTQVDALYQYQYQQVAGTSGSFISIHEQGCQHPLEGPMLDKDTYVDKNEKGEKGSKDGSLLCHKRIETGAIDSLNVSVDNTQSNSMKTQEENAENQNRRFESMAAPLKDFVSSIEKAGGSLQKDLHRSPYQQFISAGSLANCKEEVGTKAVLEHDIDSNKKALNTCDDEARASKSSNEKAGTFDSAAAMSVSEELSNSTLYTEKTDVSNQDRKYVINQSQSFQAGDHMEKNAAMTKGMAAVREHSAEEPQNNMDDYDERSPVLEHISEHFEGVSEHFEGVMKCKESNVNKELYGYTRLVQEGDTSGTTIGMKDAINDDVENPKAMVEGSVSRTMHSNNSIPCAEKIGHNHQEVELRSIQHEFQHAGSFPYHEGSFKEEETCVDKNGNPEKLREEGSGGDSDTIAELESVTKDGRGTPVTSQKGSEESQSKKTSSSNTEFDDDVFMYIQAAIGNLVRFVSQAIGKFFRL